jgi:branched-chain amino acid transport system substrate-binding protein
MTMLHLRSPVRIFLVSLALTAGLAVGVAPVASAKVKCPIRIGNIYPQSGAGAGLGHSLARGLRMGLDDVNRGGGVAGCKVEMIYYDSQSQPANAATLTQRLLFQDRVSLVVGSPMSLESLAMLQVTENNGIPLYVPSAASAKITSEGAKWVWRQRVIDLDAARALSDYVSKDLGWKRVAIIFENTDYGKLPIRNVVEPRLKENGVQVVVSEAFNPGDSDLSGQLLRIPGAKADGIIFWGHEKEGALMARQTGQLNIKTKIAANTGVVFPSFLDLLTPDVQKRTDLIAITPFVWTIKEPRQAAWIERFRKEYNGPPDQSALDAYDAVFVLKAAIEQAGSLEPANLKKALSGLKFQALGGPISFNEAGQAQRSLLIVKLTPKDGSGFDVVRVID